jgi:hypothetical protein
VPDHLLKYFPQRKSIRSAPSRSEREERDADLAVLVDLSFNGIFGRRIRFIECVR